MKRRKFVSSMAVLPLIAMFGVSAKARTYPYMHLPEFDGIIKYYSLSELRPYAMPLKPRLSLANDTFGRPWETTINGASYTEYAIGIHLLTKHQINESEDVLWSMINKSLERDRELGHLVHRVHPEVYSGSYEPIVGNMILQKTDSPYWLTKAYIRYAVE